MSGSSNKNKKKPVAGSFIPYETGYVNIAGETFFLSMGPSSHESFALTDDSLKTDTAFDLLFLGGTSNTFTDAEKATLQRVIRAIFGAGKSMTKKGLRLPCNKEEGELLIRSLLYRRSLLMDEIASYDELLAEDVHARYLRDHLDQLNKLIDEDVPQTIAPCKDTALVDPNKPAKVVGLDDDRMLKLLEIFAYLLAQGHDPVEVLGKKLPIPADILTRMAQKNAPLLRDYESEFERERGSGKRPPYTRTLIKIKKVLEDDASLLAAIAPEEALNVLTDIEKKLKINKEHKGTIEERRDGIIMAIDSLQEALARALAEVQRLQAENDRLTQLLENANRTIARLTEENAQLLIQNDAMVLEIVFWMNLFDECYKLVEDIFVTMDELRIDIIELQETEELEFTLLSECNQIADGYENTLERIWNSLGGFIERMRANGFILPSAYPELDSTNLDTLRTSGQNLVTFLEGIQIRPVPPPPPAAANRNGSMLCMLNTLYFILISQMDPAVELILIDMYTRLNPDEIELIVKVFYKIVFAIRNNLEQLEDQPVGWEDIYRRILDRMVSNGIVERIRVNIEEILSVGENFMNNPKFFTYHYHQGRIREIRDNKQTSTVIIYLLFLAILGGTLHTPENQEALRELGCMGADNLEPLPIVTLTLRTQPAGRGILTDNRNVAAGTRVQISWENNDGETDEFNHWEGPVENPRDATTRTLPIRANTEIIAHLNGPPPSETHTLTLVTNPVNEGTGTLTGDGPVNNEERREILWTANGNGYTFDHWEPHNSVEDSGSARTTIIPIIADKTITAYLNEVPPQTYTLTLRTDPENIGTLQYDNHNVEHRQPINVAAGRSQQISWTADDPLHIFSWWEGPVVTSDAYTTRINPIEANTEIIAHLREAPPRRYTLTLLTDPRNIGTLKYNNNVADGEIINVADGEINNVADGEIIDVVAGESPQISWTANPDDPLHTFYRWEGPVETSDAYTTRIRPITANTTITAYLNEAPPEPRTYTLTLRTDPENIGTLQYDNHNVADRQPINVVAGESQQISWTANPDDPLHTFNRWEGPVVTSDAYTTRISPITANTTITAYLNGRPPPPPPSETHTLTLVTYPAGQGTLTPSSNVPSGTRVPISWVQGDNQRYIFRHWKGPVDNTGVNITTTKPITGPTKITAYLTFNAQAFCDEYRRIFFKDNGAPQTSRESAREKTAFKNRFQLEEFRLIQASCPFVFVRRPRAPTPTVQRPQDHPTGLTSQMHGKRGDIPSQPRKGGMTRRGGCRHRKARHHTYKRRAH